VRATRGISLDLGEGGLGAIVQGGVHLGDTVAIDLRLSEQLLTTVAIVQHTSSVRHLRGLGRRQRRAAETRMSKGTFFNYFEKQRARAGCDG
jgi:hypothetical protein